MRNKFEEKIAASGVLPPTAKYEAIKLDYVKTHKYLPDWTCEATKTIYEGKGYLSGDERSKLLAIKRCNPGWSIIVILQHPDRRISKTSKTTYCQWCDRHGLGWMTV